MLHTAIPEQPIMRIKFATVQAALSYKDDHGGWVFVAENTNHVEWFDANWFTPSRIFTCPSTRGMNGKLV